MQSIHNVLTGERHHYVPKLLLKRFSTTGRKDGAIYQFDSLESTVTRRSIKKVASEPDYYTVSIPGYPPNMVETIFNQIETPASRIIDRMLETWQVPPKGSSDFVWLMRFVALSNIRIPYWRQLVAEIEPATSKQVLQDMLATPEAWEAAMQDYLDRHPLASPPPYLEMKATVETGGFKLPGIDPQAYHVQKTLDVLGWNPDLLARRNWGLLRADDRAIDFVLSDRPVSIDWTPDVSLRVQFPGLLHRFSELVLPLSSRVALFARFEPIEPLVPAMTVNVAQVNLLTAYAATRYVYAARDQFWTSHLKDGLGSEQLWFLRQRRG